MNNHYKWLENHFSEFLQKLGINPDYAQGLIVAEGDKCYGYKDRWKEAGIPFEHGVAIYCITKEHPWCNEVRNTPKGWVPVDEWIIDNYQQFKNILAEPQSI